MIRLGLVLVLVFPLQLLHSRNLPAVLVVTLPILLLSCINIAASSRGLFFPASSLVAIVTAWGGIFLGNLLFRDQESWWKIQVTPDGLLDGICGGFRMCASTALGLAFVSATGTDLFKAIPGKRLRAQMLLWNRMVQLLADDFTNTALTLRALGFTITDFFTILLTFRIRLFRKNTETFLALAIAFIYRLMRMVAESRILVARHKRRASDSFGAGPCSIEFRDVSLLYKSTQRIALNSVELKCPGSGLVSVRGRDKAGKSSLLQTLSGVVFDRSGATAGTILLNGKDTDDLSMGDWSRSLAGARFRPQILVRRHVFQDPRVQLVAATVEEELLLFANAAGQSPADSRAWARSQLSALGLRPTQKTFDLHYRDAKLLLTTAATAGFGLVVLDEPTAGVDEDTAGEIIRIIAAIRARGTTVFLVTHDESLRSLGGRQIDLTYLGQSPLTVSKARVG